MPTLFSALGTCWRGSRTTGRSSQYRRSKACGCPRRPPVATLAFLSVLPPRPPRLAQDRRHLSSVVVWIALPIGRSLQRVYSVVANAWLPAHVRRVAGAGVIWEGAFGARASARRRSRGCSVANEEQGGGERSGRAKAAISMVGPCSFCDG